MFHSARRDNYIIGDESRANSCVTVSSPRVIGGWTRVSVS